MLSFTDALLWPRGTVKCPMDAHFSISLKAGGHPGTFCLMFNEYCEFGHTMDFSRNVFPPAYYSRYSRDIYAYSDTANIINEHIPHYVADLDTSACMPYWKSLEGGQFVKG